MKQHRHLIFSGLVMLSGLFLFPCIATAQLLFKISNDSLQAFTYAGGDEFNAQTLNSSFWKDKPWPAINMSQEFVFTPQNIKLQDGLAVFIMSKKDSIYVVDPFEMDSNFLREKKLVLSDRKYRCYYTAGCALSQQKWHYGLYELRFKVEEGKGIWPAFWFYGGNKNEEIDAFELKGERNNEIHVDTHCPNGCDRGYKNKLGFSSNWGGWLPVSDYLHNGFNRMQLEWAPDGVTWYVNSRPLAWFKGSFSNPMNIYLNTQVAKDGRAFKPGPDETTPFPNNFYVDYLRIWKRTTEAVPLLVPQEFEQSDKFEEAYHTKPTRKRGLMYSKKKFNTEGMIHLSVSPNGKLRIKTSGELGHTGSSMELVWAGGNIVFTGFDKEQELKAASSEYELIVKTKQKEYRQKFRIKP